MGGPEVNAAGCPGCEFTVIAIVRATPGHKPLLAVALKVPLIAVALKFNVTLLVVPLIVTPLPL